MKTCEELYLIGPGADKDSFDVAELEGKVVLNFSGDLLWFQSRNIHPTYWTFLDPNTLVFIINNLNNNLYNEEWLIGLSQKSSIIYNDFQGTDTFYHLGMTTSRGINWNTHVFGKSILPVVCSMFKEIVAVPSVVMLDNFNSFYVEELKTSAQVLLHEDLNLNIDKFSCFVLPLVLWYFTNIKSIKCIGFGDFTVAREYNNSTDSYSSYMSSYERVKSKLIDLLKYKNVRIEFYNKKTYFYELENIL